MKTYSLLLLSALAATLPLSANPIRIYGTGLDDSFGFLSAGAMDTHYQLITSADPNYPGPNTFVVDNNFPNDGGTGHWATSSYAQWIGPRSDAIGGVAEGDYLYIIHFSLTGLDPSTVVLTGNWASDNESEIFLNGFNTPFAIPFGTDPSGPYSFSQLTPFSLAAGGDNHFYGGDNTISFLVHNHSTNGNNPSGLLVEISGTALPIDHGTVPEPGTIGLFASAGLFLFLGRLRRS